MSEPISSAAAGVAGWAFISKLATMGAIGAGLAALVVMSSTKPKTDEEWRVALITTVVGSIGGGAAFIMHFNLQDWAQSPIGLVALLAIVFTCGLPAWMLVRALFKYAEKHKDAGIDEIAKDVKEIL